MFTITPGMRLCAVGTSLSTTGANGQPRGWWRDVAGIGGSMNTGPPGARAGAGGPALHRTSLNPPVMVHRPTLTEIGGAKLADLIAAWDVLVTPFEPNIDGFLLEGNINDIFGGGIAPTPEETIRSQMQTILSLTAARPVLWLGPLLGYTTGAPGFPEGEDPTAFGDDFNLLIDDYNDIFREEVELAGARATYADLRQGMKDWETAKNTEEAGTGLLTTDGVHLSEWGLGVVKIMCQPFIAWLP